MKSSFMFMMVHIDTSHSNDTTTNGAIDPSSLLRSVPTDISRYNAKTNSVIPQQTRQT